MRYLITGARFALSEHIFRPHYDGGETFTSKAVGYTPEMLRRAYAFDDTVTGKGKSIAVIAALDNVGLQENINVFCEEFGLPTTEISVHYPDGRADVSSDNWLVESSLDTQWAHVFAPDAKIFAVFAKSALADDLLSAAKYAVETLRADVVSMCFGSEESARDGRLSGFMSENGSVFTASSGDVGGEVFFPSSSPYCVSVGGTSLALNSSGTRRLSETAWINSGGGASEIFEVPPYQGRFFNIYGMADGMRGTPDVSMMANNNQGVPVYVSELGGWTTAGGTSLACACFSGICACIMEKHPDIKNSTDMLSYLYGKAGTTGYSRVQNSFNDIILGKSGKYYAEEGWDFATGLGSPVIRQLLL